jgi:hypothetical protein
MKSIYQEILGSDFNRLHPQIQKRFGFSSADGLASIGSGIMEKIWHGRPFTLPFLYVGTWRRVMFPETGTKVPFTIRNYAYRDRFGRETVTWIRDFQTRRPRRFDAYMIHSPQRGKIVDYLGTHQHLAVDIDLAIDEQGGLRLRSGEQRFYEGPFAFRFPSFFTGRADVREWYDDSLGKFRIDVKVTNRFWGPLFGYHGVFDVAWHAVPPQDIPDDVKPYREEARE